jgi:hypothetical protein
MGIRHYEERKRRSNPLNRNRRNVRPQTTRSARGFKPAGGSLRETRSEVSPAS